MKKGILVLLTVGSAAHAGIPVWSFTPIGSPVISVSATGTATASYTITNNSKKSHQLVLSANTPSGITQSGGACVLVGLGSTCTLTLNINGSALPSDNISGGPILCQSNINGTPNPNQCYQPNTGDALVITRTTAPGATTLSASISQLALSVTGLTEYGVTGTPASGVARRITITNTGGISATNLNITYPTWPTGTTADSTCGASLAAGATCEITVTPGANATSDCNNNHIAPTPGVINVSADNVTTSVSIDVLVLGYSCQYQGGYVYAFDDTTPRTGSVGGKVAATSDQAADYPNGVIWSSNGTSGTTADVVNDAIYGISEISTTSSPDPSTGSVSGQVACNGAIDGFCNTNNIYVYYENYASNHPIDLAYYAAGLCKQTISDYADWYLPAICEMGYDTNNDGSGCGTLSAPTLQNMQKSLIDMSGLSGLSAPAGEYWSSTEGSYDSLGAAWICRITTSNSFTFGVSKANPKGVRCSRAF
jgi:hypothetical protein